MENEPELPRREKPESEDAPEREKPEQCRPAEVPPTGRTVTNLAGAMRTIT